MLPERTITTLLLTATLAACGGGADEAATDEMGMDTAASAEMATAEPDLSQCFLRGATLAEAAERPSPLQATTLELGATQGQLCYGAPSVRGREIFGGPESLESYGELWRAGANEATAIHLSGPATFGNIPLEAGSYSIYMLPNENEWEVFVNTNAERWGIPIDDEVRSTEIGSFTVTPEATDALVETLTYTFSPTGDGMGDLIMEWENTRLRMHLMGS